MKKLLLILITGSVLINQGCHSGHEEEGEEDAKFAVTSPMIKDTFNIKEYVCQIHAIQHIELRALEKGYLQKIYVDEGQHVKEGQPMFQIMPMIYQAELQKAQAEVNFAEIEYQNTRNLADSNVVSANELALIKAKLDKAKADLALAKTHLNFTEIKAPFNGIMDRFHVRLGSLIEEGELMTILSDNSQMWAYFNVPEAEYLDLRSHFSKDSLIEVGLKMANNKIFKYKGIVETILADFNNETGNIAFRATFQNPNGLLRHGETGNIQMNVPLKNALLIPQKATFEVLDKTYVFVVENDTVRSRQIVIEDEMPHIYAVKEGLTVNDILLLEGLRKVKNGEKVETEFEKPEYVLTHLELYAE